MAKERLVRAYGGKMRDIGGGDNHFFVFFCFFCLGRSRFLKKQKKTKKT